VFPLDDGALRLRPRKRRAVAGSQQTQEDVGLLDLTAAMLFGAHASCPVFFEEIQVVNARRQLFPQAPTLLLKSDVELRKTNSLDIIAPW
jgi:hypothetical protein